MDTDEQKDTQTHFSSEREKLRGNPYVRKVTANTVSFTEDFKKPVYDKKQEWIPVTETMHA